MPLQKVLGSRLVMCNVNISIWTARPNGTAFTFALRASQAMQRGRALFIKNLAYYSVHLALFHRFAALSFSISFILVFYLLFYCYYISLLLFLTADAQPCLLYSRPLACLFIPFILPTKKHHLCALFLCSIYSSSVLPLFAV